MFQRKERVLLRLLVVVAVFGLLPHNASAQWKAKDSEWPTYAADLAGTRYRPLDQINASNFNHLEIAWRIKTDNFGNRPEYLTRLARFRNNLGMLQDASGHSQDAEATFRDTLKQLEPSLQGPAALQPQWFDGYPHYPSGTA